MRDNGEQGEFAISDHPLFEDTLRKVTSFIMKVGEASLGRVVRETGCPADLVDAAISWLQIEDKEGLPILRAMHKAPERFTFEPIPVRVLLPSEYPKDWQPPVRQRKWDQREQVFGWR